MFDKMKHWGMQSAIVRRMKRHAFNNKGADPQLRSRMQALLTISLLLAGLLVLLMENGDPRLRELAAGWIGGLFGYWLRQ